MSATPGRQYTNLPVPDVHGDILVCTGIETAIGDGLWYDATGAFCLAATVAQTHVAKPFSQVADQGSAIPTQAIAAQGFLGISAYNQKAVDLSPNPAAHQARIWTRQKWKDYPCVPQAWEIGDLVAPKYTPGVGLSDQLLDKTLNVACAIGRVDKRFVAASAIVSFVMMSRLLEDFTNDGTVPTLLGFTQIGPQASVPAPVIVPITGGTITPPLSSQSLLLNPAAPITGVIMVPGTQDGQFLTLINISGNSITFAAVGGNIADGALAVVPSFRQFELTWSSTAGLWFHT